MASLNHKAGENTALQKICRDLHLNPVEALGVQTWRCDDLNGQAVVLKTGPQVAAAGQFLEKLAHLYAAFEYPRLISWQPGRFLLYPYISGPLLAQNDFEGPDRQAAIMELAGQLTALFQSLRLAPMFQALKTRRFEEELVGESGHQTPARLHLGLNCHPARRGEIAQSYHWGLDLAKTRSAQLIAAGGPPTLLAAFQNKLEQTTSIHLTPSGTNLAHTAFTPEHIIQCPEGRFGIVGWQVAPRPYNYMRLKYLAWSLIHTAAPEIFSRYQAYLAKMPKISPPWATAMTFTLALIEAWCEATSDMNYREEKLAALVAFMEEALGG
ncbi:MAG: hypothetical protein JRI50_11310, partial [Deltaproteobacteria bacterium]|nr:hypothetical protein [Deltaproteobacteria bacterium]MBW2135790.1 hypothetical protein [Deltaproteobacteria bacterium]